MGISSGLPAQNAAGSAAASLPQNQPPQGQPPQSPPPQPEARLITEGVTFAPRMTFEKGQTRRYGTQSSMTMRFPGENGAPSNFVSSTTMNVVLRYKVLDTKSDGVTQMSVVSEGGRMLDATGAFQNVPKEADSASRLLSLDRQSHIAAFKDPTSHKGGNGLDALFSSSNLLVPLHILPLPDRPVHVGESWSAIYAAPGKAAPAQNADASDPNAATTDVKATLTLLGIEKIGDVDTIKIKQVLTVPYTAYTDAQGRGTDARGAKGRMNMLLTFTQMLNALPENGLMVRSEGSLAGNITFEGTLRGQVPGNTMTIGGKIVAVRLEDTPAATPPKSDTK